MATNLRRWAGSWIFAAAALLACLAPPLSAQQPSLAAHPRQSDVKEHFKGLSLGVTVVGDTSAAFADAIAREIPRWKEVATKANIQLD